VDNETKIPSMTKFWYSPRRISSSHVLNKFICHSKVQSGKKDHPPSFLHYSINFRKVKIYFNIGCGGHSVENIQANVLFYHELPLFMYHGESSHTSTSSLLFFRIWYYSSLIHTPTLLSIQLIKYGWFNHSLREFPVYVIFSTS